MATLTPTGADVEVFRTWNSGRRIRRAVLWTNDLRTMALGLNAGVAGVVKRTHPIESAIAAVRSGLAVRSIYLPGDVGLTAADYTAIRLRSRSMCFESIGVEVGYSSRQVRRRLSALCRRYGLEDSDLILLGSVMADLR